MVHYFLNFGPHLSRCDEMPDVPSPSHSVSTSTRVRNEFESECIHLFGEVVNILGVPRSAGEIYGVLFASPQPLSFSDIVVRLEISKGSASQGLQLLRTLGAIKQVSPTGSGAPERLTGSMRNYYEPELGLRKLVGGVLQEKIVPLATAGSDRFVRLRHLAEAEMEHRAFLSGRVKQLETWRKRFKTLVPVLTALLGSERRK